MRELGDIVVVTVVFDMARQRVYGEGGRGADTPPRDRPFHLPRGISFSVKGNVADARSSVGGLDMFIIRTQGADCPSGASS
jgi:hypothetical protein